MENCPKSFTNRRRRDGRFFRVASLFFGRRKFLYETLIFPGFFHGEDAHFFAAMRNIYIPRGEETGRSVAPKSGVLPKKTCRKQLKLCPQSGAKSYGIVFPENFPGRK